MCIYKYTLRVAITLFSEYPLCELQSMQNEQQNWTHTDTDTKTPKRE